MTRSLIAAALLLAAAGPALAQTTNTTTGTTADRTAGDAGSSNPAVKDSDPATTTAPATGANSFTEDQARERLAKAGYQVSALSKDAQGVWTGTATQGGKSMTVGLDYKGNISAR